MEQVNFSKKYLFLVIISLSTFTLKANGDCTPQLTVHSFSGSFASKLGVLVDKNIPGLLESIADSRLPGYCKMQVDVEFQKGLKFYPPTARVNKKDSTHFYSLGYYTPTYTVQIKEANGTVLHQLSFGNKETYKRFPSKNHPKTQVVLEELWASKKDSILQSLELEYSSELKGFADFLERFRGEYLAYSNTGYVPIVEKKIYQSERKNIEYDKKYLEEINGEPGFLIDRATVIPIALKRGDQVTIISKGEIRKNNDRFSPKGLGNRLQRSYPKSFHDASYGRLLANVGYKVFDIGRGGQFTVTHPDTLKLLLNAKDNNRRISGYFEAWIWVNDRLISPQEDNNYMVILENPNGEFLPVKFSPDFSVLLGIGKDNRLVLWRVSDGKILQNYFGHPEGILAYGFLSEEPLIVTLGKDEQLCFWDVVSGKCLKKIGLSKIQIRDACFDQSVENIAYVLEENDDPFNPRLNYQNTNIYQRNILETLVTDELSKPRVLKGHHELVNSFGFTSKGDFFFSTDISGNIFLWDKKSWKIIERAKSNKGDNENFLEDFFKQHTPLRSEKVQPSFKDLQPHAGDQIIFISDQLKYVLLYSQETTIELWKTNDYFGLK